LHVQQQEKLSFAKFKAMFQDVRPLRRFEDEERTKILAEVWQELTGKKPEAEKDSK